MDISFKEILNNFETGRCLGEKDCALRKGG